MLLKECNNAQIQRAARFAGIDEVRGGLNYIEAPVLTETGRKFLLEWLNKFGYRRFDQTSNQPVKS